MTVYLLHFDRPVSHKHTTQHYVGYTSSRRTLQARLIHHEDGTGARLPAAAAERGIGFECVRVWDKEDRLFERRLKRQKNARRYCPACKAETEGNEK